MFLKNYSVQLAKDILIRAPRRMGRMSSYVREFRSFVAQNDDRFQVSYKDAYPCLSDKLETTPFDQHYIYHPAWAARILAQTKPASHVDFSSILSFASIISAFIPVKFYDYRPAQLQLDNWQSDFADLTNLSFVDGEFNSVSCMHTVEHIGLGRYGDALDAKGDIKAINELQRVTIEGGDILFVTPVGRQRIEFNAHRIYGYDLVLEMFNNCTLQEFSLVPDSGGLVRNANPAIVAQQEYGCGCFWFKKN